MNLRCLFSSCTVSNNSFVRLQYIRIEKCHVLEELIVVDNQEEERKNNIVMFPQLQYLKMYDLEKLTSFCTGDVHMLEFPSLKELWISRCPEFMVRFKRTTNDLTKKVFPNLEELIVDAEYIITNKFIFSEDLLCKLKCLDVEFVDELTTILSLDDFLQRFPTLKVLQIEGYSDWLPKEKVENGMEVIIRRVFRCYDLKYILKQESSIMNNLVILHVTNCHRLINLVPSSTSFQNLTSLEISYCNGLKNVLTFSIAKTLVRLREMKIESCAMITEIVLADDDDDHDAAKDEVIAFSELNELKLLNLKSLRSFYSGNRALNFPSLERLLVDDCTNMKGFSRGELSTPVLHKVQLNRWDEACWGWKEGLNITIEQANLQKESFLKKCREAPPSQQFLSFAPAPNLNLQTRLEILPAMVAGVWSDDNNLQLEATTQFRKLLSNERSLPTEEVIQSGVVPRFVEFLMREDYPQLQYEAAWVLRSIASKTLEDKKAVVDHGAVPIFVKLLASPSDDIRMQSVWALGNIAAESPRFRDLVLGEAALIPLLTQLNNHENLSMKRIATWTLSNLCGGKPRPIFDQVRPCLPTLAQLVHSNDEHVMSNACWGLSLLCDGGKNDEIQAVIEAGVCPRLVKLLGHPSQSVLTQALHTVGNIARGDYSQTLYIINCGALPYLLGLLIDNHKTSIKNYACWIISNITAGNREQIQAVIDAGLIGPLVNLLQNAVFYIKKEAAWAISNATFGGTHEQIKYLEREGCIKPLCDLLLCPDPQIVTVCLKALENILKVGEAEKNTDTDIGDVNQYAQLVEEAKGLEKIENLQRHDNYEIHEKSAKILETYWCGRVVGPQPGLLYAGNEENEEEDALGVM
ncbi:Importin subunit alpha-2 [Citrus sinensis]|uniref:Importin subunit alpha-2 n=1 Tax=Citrus sinensis TaxID=2711 RepID=A0ACB8KIH6_CITSI|nr:Importin subunit alpha-2 [Citrus sinensis]